MLVLPVPLSPRNIILYVFFPKVELVIEVDILCYFEEVYICLYNRLYWTIIIDLSNLLLRKLKNIITLLYLLYQVLVTNISKHSGIPYVFISKSLIFIQEKQLFQNLL